MWRTRVICASHGREALAPVGRGEVVLAIARAEANASVIGDDSIGRQQRSDRVDVRGSDRHAHRAVIRNTRWCGAPFTAPVARVELGQRAVERALVEVRDVGQSISSSIPATTR